MEKHMPYMDPMGCRVWEDSLSFHERSNTNRLIHHSTNRIDHIPSQCGMSFPMSARKLHQHLSTCSTGAFFVVGKNWDVFSPMGSSFVHLHLDLILWWVNTSVLSYGSLYEINPNKGTIIKGNSLKTTIHLFWSHRKWLPFNDPSKNTPIKSLEHLILR